MHIWIIHQRASFKAHSVHKSRNCCRFLWIRAEGAIDAFWGPRSETLELWTWKEQYKLHTFTFSLCSMHAHTEVNITALQNSVVQCSWLIILNLYYDSLFKLKYSILYDFSSKVAFQSEVVFFFFPLLVLVWHYDPWIPPRPVCTVFRLRRGHRSRAF